LKTPIDKNKPFNIKNTGMKRVRTDKIENILEPEKARYKRQR
jgi:hypothetical protein